MASFSDILTSMQNGVSAVNELTKATAQNTPATSSGQLGADKLVQIGFVRVLGISIVDGGAVGGLYDAASVTLATSDTQIYVTGTTEGFFPVNIIFTNGLVFKPGAGQLVVIFYTRF